MAIEDIERLKEKIEKDSNSKLFVPLAEEYKKAGMYDEAIDILTKGLERQPGYLSARVSLGKVYIERGMLDEAKAEFEKVIAAIPDNLYAHKKLAEIYRDLGEKEKAIKEFKMVLKLNPMDEWAATSLAEIEGSPEIQPQEEIEKQSEETIHIGEEPFKIEEEKSFEIEEEKPSEISLSKEDMELWKSHLEATKEIEEEEEKTPVISISEENVELWKAHPEAVEEVQEAIAEAVVEEPELAVKEKEVPQKPDITEADHYILQGRYLEAINVYKNLLSAEPDNKQILQRVEELKTLLKLLGKDKEALIAKLDNFLEGIRKRRDEFFGSS